MSDTKISYLQNAVRSKHNILRLDIPVHNIIFVGTLNSGTNLNGKIQNLPPGQQLILLNIFFQGNPFQIFHYDIMDIPFMSDIINRYDIGMRQAGSSLGFNVELFDEFLIRTEFAFKNFNCNIAVEQITSCKIHIRHTAGADFFQNFIAVS